jgi:hypothetical protein
MSAAVFCACFAAFSMVALPHGHSIEGPSVKGRAEGPNLTFSQAPDAEFHFETGPIRGTLRGEGKSVGLSSVVHVPSGITLSRGYGIFGHYRVFVTNQRFGTAAWDWPSTAQLLDDGGVEVRWPAESDRPFEMTAVYRWHDASTLDLETRVKAEKDLPDSEVFLASYFNEMFTNCLVFVKKNPEAESKAGFLSAKKAFGDWLMFPRDKGAVQLIRDGRWGIEPHPVDWVIMPEFGKALGMRRDPRTGVVAVLMAPQADCFALSTPHETEGHYSLYFSLFGRTIRAGEVARARSRLWIAQGPSQQQVLDQYQAYMDELSRREGETTGHAPGSQ